MCKQLQVACMKHGFRLECSSRVHEYGSKVSLGPRRVAISLSKQQPDDPYLAVVVTVLSSKGNEVRTGEYQTRRGAMLQVHDSGEVKKL